MNAPKVTKEMLESEVVREDYFIAADGVGILPPTSPLHRLTFCVLTLRNGFTVTGESACVSPENFNLEIGRKIAREKAMEKLWPLLGFRLADQLSIAQEAAEKLPQASTAVKVGDQVLFYEVMGSVISDGMLALVSSVQPDGGLGLTVLAPNGTTHARFPVYLVGANMDPPDGVTYFARARR